MERNSRNSQARYTKARRLDQVILMTTMVTGELNQGIRRKMSTTPKGQSYTPWGRLHLYMYVVCVCVCVCVCVRGVCVQYVFVCVCLCVCVCVCVYVTWEASHTVTYTQSCWNQALHGIPFDSHETIEIMMLGLTCLPMLWNRLLWFRSWFLST
jgi:hypothetical protein